MHHTLQGSYLNDPIHHFSSQSHTVFKMSSNSSSTTSVNSIPVSSDGEGGSGGLRLKVQSDTWAVQGVDSH